MRALLALAVCCLALHAQTAPHFSVKGRVVNSITGESVRGALVTLQGSEQVTGFSNGDGQFQLDNVPQGSAFISARHPGYSDLNQGRPQSLNISDNVDSLVVKIAPTAKISGIVHDSDGEAVEGLQVTCMQQVIINGRKTWQRNQGAATDEGGKFVIDNLQPGSYFLGTAQKPVYPNSGDGNRLLYAAQFYPDSPSLASAQAVDVKPGDDARVDMNVATVRGARVWFSTTPSVQFVWGSLVSADGQTVNAGFPRDSKTGKFYVPAVPPGAWTLTVHSQSGRAGGQVGEASINVGATDVDNVQVTLSDPLEIPVNIVGGDTVQAPAGRRSNGVGAFVVLAAADKTAPQAHELVGGNPSQGGSSIQNVQPGTYRAMVRMNGPSCLDSIAYGALDLTRNNLVISTDTPPQAINVTLQTNCAELDVTLNQQQAATIVVVADSLAQDPSVLGAATGKPVTLQRLAAGEYTVYAFSDITGLEYANPEAMRKYSSQHVTLTAGQKTSVSLDINEQDNR
jgi:hypothetical protein